MLFRSVAQLDADNRAFEALMQNRYAENLGKARLRIREVRIDTDRCYRNILDRIDALMLIRGEAQYTSFVTELNGRIIRFNNLLTQRKVCAAVGVVAIAEAI